MHRNLMRTTRVLNLSLIKVINTIGENRNKIWKFTRVLTQVKRTVHRQLRLMYSSCEKPLYVLNMCFGKGDKHNR